ncbi:putative DNA-binding domain-containing protein [Endozoicomonas sp. SM1973]|uniref:DNA-binding domain-containing protein n=1 Tax=Spartinivicinus marinus TaxID=2994442 RepID=A0A853I737_9GAMM|nr:DNA-binding domain-containing protein [Spartinivicinus marinus]MCX4024886.1 DNA-binding domain-containing protein [Spartinivicinus marinus]NYZ66468.1 putative DNA-binding domain-containing protein [Spartinivicinus marinus]
MSTLHNWLHLFSDSIRENEAAIKKFSAQSSISNIAEKLAIYQQNHFGNITQALQSTYQVLNEIMGEGRFKSIAHNYIKQHPPKEANINRYGESFALFLKEEPSLQDYPYLSEVAKLEWAAHTAFLSPLVKPLDITVLGTLADESTVDLKISLAPSVVLVYSEYPVLDIWQANQPGAASRMLNISQSENCLLVMREQDNFSMQPITKAEYILLKSIQAGAYFNDSIQAALVEDENINIGEVLQQYILQGIFSEIEPVKA